MALETFYVLDDGSILVDMEYQEAKDYAKSIERSVIRTITRGTDASKRKIMSGSGRVKDGTVYGEHCPVLGEYVRGPKHRSQLLKEKGLVEVGDQQGLKPTEHRQPDDLIDDGLFREFYKKHGETFSDGEVRQLKDLQKSTKPDTGKS